MSDGRYAAIIGVNKYKDDSISDLGGAANDASELYKHLTKSGDFHVDADHFLCDEKATSERIRSAISDLLWSTQKADLAVFYFSGHGLIDSYGNGFLAPHDMVRERPLVFGISMQELRQLLLAANKAKKAILVILDCCYSGIAADAKAADDAVSMEALETALGSIESASEGRVLFASSPKDAQSREQTSLRHRLGLDEPHDHGLFTFHLLEGLDGAAGQGGEFVGFESLKNYVEAQLEEDGERPPRLLASSVSRLNQIMLSRPSRQLEVAASFAKIDQRLADDDVSNLFRAVDQLGMLLQVAPGLPETAESAQRIDVRLRSMQGDARSRLLDNKLLWSEGCAKSFDELEQVVCGADVTCDVVLGLDKQMLGLLILLFEALENPQKETTLVNQLCNRDSRVNSLVTATSLTTRAGLGIGGRI